MINTSGIHQELFNRGAIQEYLVKINGYDIYDDMLYESVKISENLYETDSFCIGSCCASEIKLTIKSGIINVPLNTDIEFMYRYIDGETYSEWVNRFKGTVDSVEVSDNGKMSITGVSVLYNNEKYSRLIKSIVTYPVSARFMARTIAERLGVSLYNELDIADVYLYSEPNDDTLLVDILKDIALLSCGNWTISQGDLKLVVQNSSVAVVGEYGVGNIDELGTLRKIDGIKLYGINDVEFGAGANSFDDFILNFQSENASQVSADYIYKILKDFEYSGYRSTSTYINPAVELGDYFTIYGTDNAKQLCVSMEWTFDGSCVCNVECPFKEIDNEIVNNEQQDIEAEINSALPFIVRDFNKNELINDNDNEKYVAMIPINMVRDNVDADAGFRTNINVDNDGVLTERFYRDGVEELFSPVVMDIKKGRHLISDDHAYFNVSKGRHNFVASLQFDGGTMEIEPRKTLYTIEASRIGYREIAIDGTAIDIAFSDSELASGDNIYPREVWLLIKGDDEVINVKHFEYNFGDESNIKVIDDIDYAINIKNGAIEFSGHWEEVKYYNNKKIFVSDGQPKVALIKVGGELSYYNYNNPIVPLYNIETSDVVDVSMVQGWNFKNIFSNENDMGMIVAYIMNDGKLYYKTIADGTLDIERREIEFAEATYPLKEIRTFRTNDYRVGFTVSDSNGNLFTALTERYYQGDSVESVYLSSSFSGNSINEVFGEFAIPKAIDGNNVNNEKVEVEFNYNAIGTELNVTGIYLVDSKPTPQIYRPINNNITHTETSKILEMEIFNPLSNAVSIIQDWGIYESVKGIGDAITPIYAVVENSNLMFEHSFGGQPPLKWEIDNQKSELPNLKPIGRSDIPTPFEQAREEFLSASFGEDTVSVDFLQISAYNGYNEFEKINTILSDSNFEIVGLEEVLKQTNDNDNYRFTSQFKENQLEIFEWTVISVEPV